MRKVRRRHEDEDELAAVEQAAPRHRERGPDLEEPAGLGIIGMDENRGLVAAPLVLLGDLRGVALGAAVTVAHAHGLVIAPALFSVIGGEGSPGPSGFSGLSLSAVNWIRGEQRGVAVGIVNYAAELHGVQVGVVNIAGNNSPPFRVLPIVNAHFD